MSPRIYFGQRYSFNRNLLPFFQHGVASRTCYYSIWFTTLRRNDVFFTRGTRSTALFPVCYATKRCWLTQASWLHNANISRCVAITYSCHAVIYESSRSAISRIVEKEKRKKREKKGKGEKGGNENVNTADRCGGSLRGRINSWKFLAVQVK